MLAIRRLSSPLTLDEDADLAVFVVAAIEQLVDGEFLELADGVDQDRS